MILPITRQTDTYDSEIFTAEKNKDFSRAYLAKKNVQDYVFADGTAEKSIERKFAEDMDLDDKVVVYAKFSRGLQIPTPVGNYAPDWAIAFQKGTVKHIYFVAETKGSMNSMDLCPIEQETHLLCGRDKGLDGQHGSASYRTGKNKMCQEAVQRDFNR